MGTREDLAAEFAPAEVRHFQGRGNKTYDYIEDETVMDRLDEVLGVGNWSIRMEAVSVADGIVKATIEAIVDGKGVVFEGHGYTSNADGEALKEAESDAIRRCGRYLGIGRYLYRKHDSVTSGPARTAPPPPVRASAPPPDDDLDWDSLSPVPFRPIGGSSPADVPTDECPIHHVKWAGEPGDLFHKDPAGKWCRHPDNVRKPASARR